ncbi:2'-5' RNA ligase family protein [Halostella pelagica]|uniref:2'-5' RNA ligase family protein n=1 Tax=Halostella pelagica TaxID=2583824 RepID=UPI001080E523|nr:2'-5' RNA ligase family protein [Halostella pelagica]
MFSINAPVPGRVARIASDLHPSLVGFDRIREHHSLLVKRFGDPDHVASLQHEARRAMGDAPAFEVAVTGVDYFSDPPEGSAPVVYLTVESPGLRQIHDRLVERFGAVDMLEGDDYTPHVTLARDGSEADARRLAEREIEPVTWTVSELQFWDGTYGESVSTVSLP